MSKHYRLVTTDRKAMRSSKVRAWLRECEAAIDATLPPDEQERIALDALWDPLVARVREIVADALEFDDDIGRALRDAEKEADE